MTMPPGPGFRGDGRLRHSHCAGASSHKDVQTTMVYTHVLNRGGRGVDSPLDRLRKGISVESRGIMRTEASA